MNAIALIDIGGSSIKFGSWDGHNLTRSNSVTTPSTIHAFYQVLTDQVNSLKEHADIVGVAISSPGAVNKQTGQIEGSSAIKYIHFFNIQKKLAKLFDLPVTIENDANCAALAEVADGAAQGLDNLLFIVIGTGIGGAVIVNGRVWHGAHLFGGEFGYMMADQEHILSELASPVKVAKRYTDQINDGHLYNGKEVLELADQGDSIAKKEVKTMYDALGKAIYNLQYSFDPEVIVLGGAISNNQELIPKLTASVDAWRKKAKISTIMPTLVTCQYTDAANLRGAAVDFLTRFNKIEGKFFQYCHIKKAKNLGLRAQIPRYINHSINYFPLLQHLRHFHEHA